MSQGLALSSKPLLYLYGSAVADGMLHSSIVWTTLLFLQHIGYTDPKVDPSYAFFVFASGLSFLTPVFVTTPLSILASNPKYGSIYALSFGNIIIAVGVLLFSVSRVSRLVYCVATVGFSFLWALRLVRVSLAVRLVNPRDSTMAATVHQASFSCGFMVGPLLWFAVQCWRGSIYINEVLIIDRFTLLFLANAIVCVLIAVANPLVLDGAEEAGNSQATETEDAPQSQELSDSSSTTASENTSLKPSAASSSAYEATIAIASEENNKDKKLIRSSLLFFGTCMFLYRTCSGIIITCNQAVVIDIFNLSDSQVSFASLGEAMASFLLAVIMSRLAQALKVQQVTTMTLLVQLFGLMLFLPIFPTFTLIQGIAGFVLVKIATMVFAGVCVSMLSQTLGPLYKHHYGGYIWTTGMMGMAASQFALTPFIIPFVATWKFSLFIIPNAMVFALMTPAVKKSIIAPSSPS